MLPPSNLLQNNWKCLLQKVFPRENSVVAKPSLFQLQSKKMGLYLYFSLCVSVGFSCATWRNSRKFLLQFQLEFKKTLSVVFPLLNTFTVLGRLFFLTVRCHPLWSRQLRPGDRWGSWKHPIFFISWPFLGSILVCAAFFCFLGGGFDCRIPEGSLTQQWGGGDTSIWHTLHFWKSTVSTCRHMRPVPHGQFVKEGLRKFHGTQMADLLAVLSRITKWSSFIKFNGFSTL